MDLRLGWLVRLRWLVGALVGVIVVAGCGLGGGEAEPVVGVAASQPGSDGTPGEGTPGEGTPGDGTPGHVTEEAVPSVAPATPSPSPSTRRAKPKPARTKATPTEKPNNFELPACATREGRAVTKPKVKSALLTAAGKTYWPTSAPKLKLPKRLVLATAWHESGWQADIVNCDGGRGLMQVMPDTEAFINQRFGQSFDSRDYRQNALLGANYLAWLTKAFGDSYFKGSYDLSASKCKSHSSMCLLNMVIAGYNVGRGGVDAGYADKQLPNPGYVDVVRSLMKSCYCDKY